MNRDEEREAIRRAVLSIERTTGSRPIGWYCREMSVSTRELVVEEGGFLYDSDCYNDDLPYWSRVLGRPHLIVPYGLVVNDARYVTGNGFASPEHFYEMARAHLDRLRNDGDDVSRMMSIGLHPRITGNPARADALARFIEYAQSLGDVWFARRSDIARTFVEQQPAAQWLGPS
jgi:peptidoglycan/xylan/chitin deacetylase (PgdA/CDA1 family)